MLPEYFDLFVAAGLIVVVIVVYVGSRVGILPSKSVGAVSAAVFGGMLFMWFGWWRRRHADKQIEALKDRIADRERRLDAVQQQRKLADAELTAATAALNNQLAAVTLERDRIAAQLAKETARINALDAPSVHAEYVKAIAEEQEREREARQRQRRAAAQPANAP